MLPACCQDFDKDTEAAAPTEGGESRPRKGASRRAMALAAGFMALGAAACGAAATAVFVVYQPVGGTADAARYEVHYKWGIVAWTAAWAATAVAAPLGWIAAL